mgnify:CR=1 FL=1
MAPYVFMLAAVVNVVPIVFLFKVLIGRLKEDTSLRNSIMTKFFIGVATIEVIPILLIVYGMMDQEKYPMSEMVVPGAVVLLMMGLASIAILLQRRIDVPAEAKETVNTFTFVALALAMSIPIISIVGLLTHLQQ